MKTRFQRIVSLLLVMVMVWGGIPVDQFASADDNVKGVIRVGGDFSGSITEDEPTWAVRLNVSEPQLVILEAKGIKGLWVEVEDESNGSKKSYSGSGKSLTAGWQAGKGSYVMTFAAKETGSFSGKVTAQAAPKPKAKATKKPAAEATKAPAEAETEKPVEEATEKPAAEETKKLADEATEAPAAVEEKKTTEEATEKPVAEETKKSAVEATETPVAAAPEKSAKESVDDASDAASDTAGSVSAVTEAVSDQNEAELTKNAADEAEDMAEVMETETAVSSETEAKETEVYRTNESAENAEAEAADESESEKSAEGAEGEAAEAKDAESVNSEEPKADADAVGTGDEAEGAENQETAAAVEDANAEGTGDDAKDTGNQETSANMEDANAEGTGDDAEDTGNQEPTADAEDADVEGSGDKAENAETEDAESDEAEAEDVGTEESDAVAEDAEADEEAVEAEDAETDETHESENEEESQKEAAEGYAFAFDGKYDAVYLSDIITAVGAVFAKENYRITVSNSSLISLADRRSGEDIRQDGRRIAKDMRLTALDYFDEVMLTMTSGENHRPERGDLGPDRIEHQDGQDVVKITLRNPKPAPADLNSGDVTVSVYDETEALALVSEYGLTAESVDGQAVGYAVFDISLADAERVSDGGYIVPVELETPITLPSRKGMHIRKTEYELFHITESGADQVNQLSVKTEDGQVTGFTFRTDGFSAYVLRYTVDFQYNEYAWSLTGNGSVSLQALFRALGIEDNADDAASVTFSDASLISVEKQNGEWTLVSLRPFDTNETLMIVMEDGTTYRIAVTDARDEYESIALNEIADLTVSATTPTSGLLRKGASLTVMMNFTVRNSTDIGEILANRQLDWIYDLTGLINDSQYFVDSIDDASGSIYDNGDYVGEWGIQDGLLTFEVAEDYLSTHQNNISGFFNLTLEFSEDELGTDYKTKLVFPEAGNIDVTFQRPFTLSKSLTDDGDVDSNAKWGGTTTVYVGEEGDLDMENFRIPYRITINNNMTKADLSDVIVSDAVSGGAEFNAESFTVTIGVQKYTYDDLSDYISFDTAGEAETFTIDFGKWTDDGLVVGSDDIIIEYLTTYNAVENLLDEGKESAAFSNSAEYTIGGDKSPSSTTNTTLKYVQEPRYVDKTSESNDAELHYQTEYTYTATFGSGYADHTKAANMAGQTIKDTMSGYSKLISDIIVTDGDGNEHIVYSTKNAVDQDFVDASGFDLTNSEIGEEAATLFTMAFDDSFDDEYTGPFTITYTMKVNPPAGYTGYLKVTNIIDETGDLGNANAHAENQALVGILTVGKDISNYNADGTVTWAIPIEVEDGWMLYNVYLEEFAEEFCYYYTFASDGYTKEKKGVFTFLWDRTVVTDLNGNSVTGFTTIPAENSVYFEQLDQSVIVYLTAEPDYALANGDRIHNEAGVVVPGYIPYTVEDDKEFKSQDYTLVKSVTYDKDAKEYTWTVDINHYKAVIEPDFEVYFEDVLPKGMELVADTPYFWDPSYKVNLTIEHKISEWSSNTVQIYVEPSDGKIGPFNLNKAINWGSGPDGISENNYIITYTTKATSDAYAMAAENGGTVQVTNVASTFDEDGNYKKSDDATVRIDVDAVEKTDNGTHNESGKNYIDYSIIANEDEYSLNDGNDLTIRDELPDNTYLDVDSVEVLDENGDNAAKRISYDSSSNTLIIVIPDQKKVTVTYSVVANGYGLDSYVNRVTLCGKYDFEDETDEDHYFEIPEGGLIGDQAYFEIWKYDKEDITKSLAGAEFEVYQGGAGLYTISAWGAPYTDEQLEQLLYNYLGASDGLTWKTVNVTQEDLGWGFRYDYEIEYSLDRLLGSDTSTADGSVAFKDLTLDFSTVYYWKETKAPEGYVVTDDSRHYFVLYSVSPAASAAATKASAQRIIAKYPNLDISLLVDHATWYVPNEHASLTLRKEVEALIADADQEYTFIVTLTDENGAAVSGTFHTENQGGKAGTVTFDENGEAVVSLKADESLTIIGMATSWKYAVKETDYEDTGLSPDQEEFSGDFAEDAEVTFVNRESTGMLKLYKAFSIQGRALSEAETELLEKLQFTITTTMDDGTVYYVTKQEGSNIGALTTTKKVFTYADFADGYMVIDYIPVREYVITETNAGTLLRSIGYTLTAVEIDGADVDPTGTLAATAEVRKDAFTKVHFRNTYTQNVGTLTVSKAVTVDGEEPDEDSVFTEKTYRVAAYANVYVKDGKVVAAGTSGATQMKVYYATTGDALLDGMNRWVEIQAGSGNAVTWSNLPEGTYYVEEMTDDAGVEGYELTARAGGAVTVVKDGTAETTVTNAYTRKTGSVEITKKLMVNGEDRSAENTDKIFYVKVLFTDAQGDTYYITGSNGAMTKETAAANVTETALSKAAKLTIWPGAAGKISFTGVPTGTYTVYEVDEDGEVLSGESTKIAQAGQASFSYDLSATTAEAKLTDTSASAEVINHYISGRYNIAVTKQWVINGRISVPEDQTLEVKLTRGTMTGEPDGEGNPTYVQDSTFGADGGKSCTLTKDNNWTTVMTGLQETDPDGNFYYYKWEEGDHEGWAEGDQVELQVCGQNEDKVFLTRLINSKAEVTIPVQKNMTGAGSYGGLFTFTLAEDVDNSVKFSTDEGKTGLTVTPDAKEIKLAGGQSGSFTVSGFGAPGTYTYTVTEDTATAVTGLTYDPNPGRTVTVVVGWHETQLDNGTTIKDYLEVTSAESVDPATGETVNVLEDAVTFTNEYEEEEEEKTDTAFVEKKWYNKNGAEIAAPSSFRVDGKTVSYVTVKLQRKPAFAAPDSYYEDVTRTNSAGGQEAYTVQLSEENNWSYLATDIPKWDKYPGLTPYYRWVEVDVPDGYVSSSSIAYMPGSSGSSITRTTIVNQQELEYTLVVRKNLIVKGDGKYLRNQSLSFDMTLEYIGFNTAKSGNNANPATWFVPGNNPNFTMTDTKTFTLSSSGGQAFNFGGTASGHLPAFNQAGYYKFMLRETRGSIQGMEYSIADPVYLIIQVVDNNGALSVNPNIEIYQEVQASGRSPDMSYFKNYPVPFQNYVVAVDTTSSGSSAQISNSSASQVWVTINNTYDDAKEDVYITKILEGAGGDADFQIRMVPYYRYLYYTNSSGQTSKYPSGFGAGGNDSFDPANIPMPEGSESWSAGSSYFTSSEYIAEVAGNTSVKLPSIYYTLPSTISLGSYEFPVVKAEYEYLVYEVIPDAADQVAGMTYDDTAYILIVTVEKDSSGKLTTSHSLEKGTMVPGMIPNGANYVNSRTSAAWTATLTGNDSIAFTNTNENAGAEIAVQKKIVGNTGYDTSELFSFELEAANGELADGTAVAKDDVPMPTAAEEGKQTKTAKANGTAAFQSITYDKAGTYYYTVTEIEPDSKTEGMTYDTTPKYVRVTVALNAENKLRAAVAYADAEEGQSADALTYAELTDSDTANVITNVYHKVTQDLAVSKVVTAGGNVNAPEGGYVFTLEKDSGDDRPETDTLPDSVTVYVTVPEVEAGTSSEPVEATFDAITFVEAGTYTYTITEQKPSSLTPPGADILGMSYDTEPKSVTVVIKEDEDTRELTVESVTYGEEEVLTVTNLFILGKLHVTKAVTVDGEEPETGSGFEDRIYFVSVRDENGDYYAVSGENLGQTPHFVELKHGETVTWENMGAHTYTVEEKEADTDGGIADVNGYGRVTTYVLLDDEGEEDTEGQELTLNSENMEAALKVKNDYTTKTGSLTISKEVTSDVASDQNEAFLFTLTFDPAITGEFGGVYIEEGAAQLWLKHGESITLKGIPYGTTFEVKELADTDRFAVTIDAGAAADEVTIDEENASASGTIGDTAAEVSLGYKNEALYTRATVTKVWDDNEDSHKKRPSELVVILKAGEETVTSETLKKGNNWTATVENLPVYKNGTEIQYTWEEAEVPTGYAGSVTNGKAKADGETYWKSVLTNTYLTGGLVITKTFAGTDEVDEETLNTLTFTITGPDDFEETVTWADFTDGKYELTDLVPGKYGVVEENAYSLITNYSLDIDNSTVSGAANVIGAAAEPVSIELKNTYIEDKGKLTIVKAFCGVPKKDTPWVEEELKKLTFTVVGTDADGAEIYNEAFTYEDFDVEGTDELGNLTKMLTIEDLKIGDYTVTESGAEGILKNYVLQATSITDGSASVVKDAEVSVILKNNYKADVAELKIQKTWSENLKEGKYAEANEEAKKNLVIEIQGTGETNSDFFTTVTWADFKENGTLTMSVPLGTYEVTEKNAGTILDHYTLITSGDDGSVTSGETEVKKAAAGEEAEEALVELVNNYEENTGELIIIKTFTGIPEDPDLTALENLTFTVTGPSYPQGLTLTWDKFEVDNEGLFGKYVFLKGLKFGTYTVKETVSLAKGLFEDVHYTMLDTSVTSGKVEVIDGESQTIRLDNIYEQDVGSLKITKKFSGAPEDANLDGLNFHITGPYDYSYDISYAAFEGGAYTIENLPVGTYTVEETNAEGLIASYELVADNSTTSGEAEIEKNKTATVSLTNTYTELLGSLRIVKKFRGIDNETLPANLRFRILGPNGFDQTVNYSSFDEDGTYTLDGLSLGSYTVYETNAGFVNEAWTLLEDSVTAGAAIVEAKATSTIELTNRYEIAMTSVAIMKVWDDVDNLDGSRPESLTVQLLANGAYIRTAVLNDSNQWMAEAEVPLYNDDGLINYTWTEPEVEGYILSDRTILGNVTVMTNTHNPELVSTSVTKIWNDSNNAAGLRPARLRVTLLNTGATYILSAVNNWSVTVDDLPKYYEGEEITYTWSEQSVAGYASSRRVVDGVTIFTNSMELPPTSTTRRRTPIYVVDDYETPLGVDVLINHVGDCFD